MIIFRWLFSHINEVLLITSILDTIMYALELLLNIGYLPMILQVLFYLSSELRLLKRQQKAQFNCCLQAIFISLIFYTYRIRSVFHYHKLCQTILQLVHNPDERLCLYYKILQGYTEHRVLLHQPLFDTIQKL